MIPLNSTVQRWQRYIPYPQQNLIQVLCNKMVEQAGAELGQAQVKLDDIVVVVL